MSNPGKGRGALMKHLLETQSSRSGSSGDDRPGASVPSVTLSSHTGGEDSGVGVSQSPTLSSSQKTSGRGHTLGIVPSSSDSSHLKPSYSAGRGRLLQSIQSTLSTSDSQEESVRSLPSSGGKGRGRLFEKLSKESQIVPSAISQLLPQQIECLTGEVEKVKVSETSSVSSATTEIEKEPEAVIKRGEFGQRVNAATNYLRLKSNPNKGVFEYEVRFTPSVDSKGQRMRYLNEHKNILGAVKTFDGVILYLPIQLKDQITILNSRNLKDNTEIEIEIIYKRKKPLRECIHLYNVLFDRIMKTLNYVRFDRKQYDPTSPKIIPQYKLEVWPGYVTAVDEYEDGIMLCCDVSHRILCQSTVLDKIHEIYHETSNDRGGGVSYQDEIKKALLGAVVLTRYNNKTYRIDDIDFQANPQSKFKLSDGSEISYLQYYENQYNITIRDYKQPLLISMKQRRVAGKEVPEELVFCLIPEICYLTGLRDDLRSDYKVMKEIATFTRVTPNQRLRALEKFYENISNCKEAREILSNWGLELCDKPDKLLCRQLPEEEIIFARNKFSAGVSASFSKYAVSNELIEVANISNWLLIHTKNNLNVARSFLDHIQKVCTPMGIYIYNKPHIKILNDDRTDTYINALRQQIKSNIQIVVLICPTSRDDRYAAIKKVCCSEIPVPSQVINARTLSNDQKNRSIVQKIVLQMNCKLGGTLWSVRIPSQNLMICGIDSYHDAGQKGNSVAAFVASINFSFTKWYSRAVIQTKKEEIVNGLCASLKFALQAYEKANNTLPDRIMIYRDGVGDGQLKLCSEYEIPQFQEACRLHKYNYEPRITFIVVQKRINTRIFAEANRNEYKNPDPGFILDHTVTRRYLYDFFLVSQSVREGTVSPTHYVVVKDYADFKPDIIQRISYKLCFLYYNWPGTVRVPACCQYAHKLAYLVGQNIKRPTSENLATKLFYL